MAQKKRINKLAPVLVAVLLIIVITAVGIITASIKKYTPSDTKMDLNSYYGLESEEDVALVLQNVVGEQKGKLLDGHVYVDYNTASNLLGGRFYWDAGNAQMLYSTPTEIFSILPESTSYTAGGVVKEENYKIIRQMGDTLYLALDFMQQYMKISSTVYEKPNKAVIEYQWGEQSVVTTSEDTKLRYQGGIKSEVLSDIAKGTELVFIEDLGDWTQVATKDGFNGYVSNKTLSKPEKKTAEYKGSFTEEYTSLTRDFKINLAWHQVTSEAANGMLSDTLANVTGVNVISPTWFSVTSAEGTISSLASPEYVAAAHGKGMEVWGLIDNFDKNVSTLTTLSNTTSRNHLTETLVSEALRVGLDGINVDFETLTEEEIPHFIQFLREMSISCRKNNLVLSVDSPVPEYTSFYNRKEQGIIADYVIIMGYDEHTTGSEEAGSVASLPFVIKGIESTLKEVPANKVINGVPLYTRMWLTSPNKTVTSEVMSMDQADQAVTEKGMEKYWDKEASQNYAELETDGGKLQIWLEDEQSLEEKMKLIPKYNLGGVAQWKLGFERPAVWGIFSNYLSQ